VRGAALYLHLRALGLRLVLADQPEDPTGYAIRAYGLGCLEPGERERARRLLRANKAVLVTLLASGSPDAWLCVRRPVTGATGEGPCHPPRDARPRSRKRGRRGGG
jgi:hypothetical protein